MTWVSRVGVKTTERPPVLGAWHGGLRAQMNRLFGRGRSAQPSAGERPAPARGKLSEPSSSRASSAASPRTESVDVGVAPGLGSDSFGKDLGAGVDTSVSDGRSNLGPEGYALASLEDAAQLVTDFWLYGNAFMDADGKRVDPGRGFAMLSEPGVGASVMPEARADGNSRSGASPGSESFAMTPAGRKIHRVGPTGMTLCGFSTLQMVMVEDPLRRSLLCEWCVAA